MTKPKETIEKAYGNIPKEVVYLGIVEDIIVDHPFPRLNRFIQWLKRKIVKR